MKILFASIQAEGVILSGRLKEHLFFIQEQAETRFDMLVEQMAEREGVPEEIKTRGADALGKKD